MSAKQRKRDAVAGKVGRVYDPPRIVPERTGLSRSSDVAYLMFGREGYPGINSIRKIRSISDAIKSVHDVLEIGARSGGDVVASCRNLKSELRVKLWRRAVGYTFAEQVERAALGGARVRIMLRNSPEVAPISGDLLDLVLRFQRAGSDRIRILVTNETEAEKTYPHFTLVRDGVRDRTTAFFEPKSVPAPFVKGKRSVLTLETPLDGYLIALKKRDTVEGVNRLYRNFDKLFEKSYELAGRKESSEIYAA